MKIIETCPRCGADLIDVVIATYPEIVRKECWSCGWASQGEKEEVVRIPFGGNRSFPDTTPLNNYTTSETITNFRFTPMGPSNKAYDGSPCVHCPNNPKNGGSGICHCILGQPQIIC